MTANKRIIVGITGSSGVIYGVEILRVLKHLGYETHLIISKAGDIVRAQETVLSAQELRAMADHYHHVDNLAASISSGSFKTMGMIIAPCSMKTLGEIANSITSNLVTRAAEVVLKERRRLVLLTREFPLTAGHIKNMLAVTEMGGIIAPPVPAFYTHPQSIEDIVAQTVGRTLDLFDIDTHNFPRWEGQITTLRKNERNDSRTQNNPLVPCEVNAI